MVVVSVQAALVQDSPAVAAGWARPTAASAGALPPAVATNPAAKINADAAAPAGTVLAGRRAQRLRAAFIPTP